MGKSQTMQKDSSRLPYHIFKTFYMAVRGIA